MNNSNQESPAARQVRRRTLAMLGGICFVIAAYVAGMIAFDNSDGAEATAEAPQASYERYLIPRADQRTVYYIVPTQEFGEELLADDDYLMGTLLQDSVSDNVTNQMLVVATPAQEALLAMMLADSAAETTSYVDFRPHPPTQSQPGPASDGPATIETALPQSQPYHCDDWSLDAYAFMMDLLAGFCN